MIPTSFEVDGGDARYNPLPNRVRVPLCPAPRPTAGFLRFLASLGGDPSRTDRAVRSALGRRLGVDPTRVLLTASGTQALLLALHRLRRSPGDEVVLPAFSCPSLVAAVLACDMVPVLCDLGEDWAVGPDEVRPLLTGRTRAVIAAHLFGTPADLPGLRELCDGRGIDLVDDAAQALGGSAEGRALGTWGRYGVLSFGRHKPVLAGGYGALVLPEGESPAGRPGRPGSRGLAALLRWTGTDALRWADSRLPARLRLHPAPLADARIPLETYELADAIGALGTSGTAGAGMTAVAGALILDQLSRIDEDRARVRAVVAGYLSALSPFLRPPPDRVMAGGLNFVPLLCRPAERHDIAAYFAAQGVETTWLYFPMHHVRQYHGRVRVERLPLTDELWRSVLCVPGRARHTTAQSRRVARAVAAARPAPPEHHTHSAGYVGRLDRLGRTGPERIPWQ